MSSHIFGKEAELGLKGRALSNLWMKAPGPYHVLDVGAQVRHLLELESPGPTRYLIGALVMMVGVVLPVGYMMFRNKRVPGTSTYGKQT